MLLKSLRCPCDAGNSAPMEHNLAKYLAKHPECEVYCGQDVHGGKGTGGNGARGHSVEVVAAKPRAAGPIQKRVTLWHKVQKRKVVGNAAPLEKNVHTYLAKHPEYEIYDAHGHEKEKDIQRAVEKVMTAIVTSVAALNRDLEEKNRPSATSRKRKSQKQVSGGKRPKESARSTAASAAPRGARQVPSDAGLSFLLQIASYAGDPGTECNKEQDVAGGLLELLAQATHGAVAAAAPPPVAQESDLAKPSASPESPPFSPMAQPVHGETIKMEELSLAPSPVRAAAGSNFHRLS
jgi:hypothetical protein